MKTSVDVILSPAELADLPRRHLAASDCVVFDILRATSTMTCALDHGAAAIIPVEEIEAALAWRRQDPTVLLAGERGGRRITAAQADGKEFDLGNSPREFTPARVAGRVIVMTTTNGTRALAACRGAGRTWIGSFFNLSSLAAALRRRRPRRLWLVGSGNDGTPSYEDTLGAGALLAALAGDWEPASDAAVMAHDLYRAAAPALAEQVALGRHAQRLLAESDLAPDVALCLDRDRHPVLGLLTVEGRVELWSEPVE